MLKHPLVKCKTLYQSCQEKIVQCAFKMSFKLHLKILSVEIMQVFLFKYFFNTTVVATIAPVFIVISCCFLRDLLLGAIIFYLVLCSILIKTGIGFMYGNIDISSAKCPLSHCITYYRNQCNGGGRRGIHVLCPFYISFWKANKLNLYALEQYLLLLCSLMSIFPVLRASTTL